MSEREWHYVYQRSREGPIRESALRTRLENAELPMDVLVWCDALADWVAAHEEPTFQNIEICPRAPPSSPVPARLKPQSAIVPKSKAATQEITNPVAAKSAAVPHPSIVKSGTARFYVYREAGNSGPYTQAAIVQMFAKGAVTATDLIWREGLPTWTPVSVILGLPQSPPPIPPAATSRSGNAAQTAALHSTPGIGRCAFVGIVFGISIGATIIGGIAGDDGIIFVVLLAYVGYWLATARRLINIGYNPWLSIVTLIPIVSLIVTIPCLLAPANYAQTKQLDRAAKVTIGLIALFILFIIIAVKS